MEMRNTEDALVRPEGKRPLRDTINLAKGCGLARIKLEVRFSRLRTARADNLKSAK